MLRDGSSRFYLIAGSSFLLSLGLSVIACSGVTVPAPRQANESPGASPRSGQSPTVIEQSNQSLSSVDPTCCDDKANGQLKRAWQDFVAKSPYRMVSIEDLRDPEAKSHRPYAYSWGDLGFDRDPSQSYHLAVIVIDSSKSENERFGIVIFSAPRHEHGIYKPYWLLRDKDLSRAFFSGFSGYLEVVINNANGKPDGCDIHWSDKAHAYVCLK